MIFYQVDFENNNSNVHFQNLINKVINLADIGFNNHFLYWVTLLSPIYATFG
jgi:hypothetical protein